MKKANWSTQFPNRILAGWCIAILDGKEEQTVTMFQVYSETSGIVWSMIALMIH